MILYKVADKLVFNFLNKINYGFLEIKTIYGQVLSFGSPKDNFCP